MCRYRYDILLFYSESECILRMKEFVKFHKAEVIFKRYPFICPAVCSILFYVAHIKSIISPINMLHANVLIMIILQLAKLLKFSRSSYCSLTKFFHTFSINRCHATKNHSLSLVLFQQSKHGRLSIHLRSPISINISMWLLEPRMNQFVRRSPGNSFLGQTGRYQHRCSALQWQ